MYPNAKSQIGLKLIDLAAAAADWLLDQGNKTSK